MAQLKFYRKAQAPTSPVEGTIWFNTTDKTIQIYAGNTWEKYAGNLVQNAEWSDNILTITKHDGSSIALNFSDMASASAMSTELGKKLNIGTTSDTSATTSYYGLKKYTDEQVAAKNVSATSNSTDYITASAANNTVTIAATTKLTEAVAKAEAALPAADQVVKSIDTTATNGVNLSNTNGKLDVTVTPGTISIHNNSVVTGGAVYSAIDIAKTNLNSEIKKAKTDVYVAEGTTHLSMSQTSGEDGNTIYTIGENDIASAATLAEVKGKVDAFFEGADIDKTVNQYKDTLKELQTYITEDAAAAVTMTESIAANKRDIAKLADAKVNNKAIATAQIGTDGATTLVVSGVTLNGADIKIAGYTKGTATDLAAADTINQAFGKLEARVDAAAAGGVQSVNGYSGNVTIGTGSKKGTILVSSGTGAEQGVEVAGLKSAAYTESSDYATAAQGSKADTAIQGVFTSENGVSSNYLSATKDASTNEVTIKANVATDLIDTDYILSGGMVLDALATAKAVQNYVTDMFSWEEFE